jgi:hypothetical protein
MGGEIHEADYPTHHTRPMYEIRQKNRLQETQLVSLRTVVDDSAYLH